MMQTSTPENSDDAITATTTTETANPSVPVERRFEAVVNFIDLERVGDCMLELNIKGYIYTNGVLYTEFEPIDAEETNSGVRALDVIPTIRGFGDEIVIPQFTDIEPIRHRSGGAVYGGSLTVPVVAITKLEHSQPWRTLDLQQLAPLHLPDRFLCEPQP
jgi:hypothetical protein